MPVVLLENGAAEGVRILTLNDPDKRNALSPRLQAELAGAVDVVAADPHARVLVVAGNGPAFSAGADLPAVFGKLSRPVGEIRAGLRTIYDSFLRVRRLEIPTIAAVDGPAVGAGVNLAMSCDLRLASTRATFGVTFTKLGLHPGGGCTYYMVQALGRQQALSLLLDGGALTAGEALAAGIVLDVVDDPLEEALDIAARWTRNSSGTSSRPWASRPKVISTSRSSSRPGPRRRRRRSRSWPRRSPASPSARSA